MNDDIVFTLRRVTATPELVQRDELLDVLVDRISAGGADVADAPVPAAHCANDSLATTSAADPATPDRHDHADDTRDTAGLEGSRGRFARRAAGIGVSGWILLGAGTAAAAAAALTWEPLPWNSPADDPLQPIVRADAPATAGPDATPFETVIPAVVAATDADASGHAGGEAGVAPAPAAELPVVELPSVETADPSSEHPDPAGMIGGAVDGALDDVGDVIDGVLPAGPVADTVVPVIESVQVSGLLAWASGALGCSTDGTVTVHASDNVGVESVTVRIVTPLGSVDTASLTPGSGAWSGALAPLSVLDVGVLGGLVDVHVTATDAAGNSATSHAEISVGVGSCLGG